MVHSNRGVMLRGRQPPKIYNSRVLNDEKRGKTKRYEYIDLYILIDIAY